MDPQGTTIEQDISQQPVSEPISEYPPPRRNITIFIVIGVVFLVLLIVVAVVFLLIRARTSTQPQGGTSALTPQPTPSFYQLMSSDIQKQEVKLNEIGNDIRELETVFKYESVNFSDVLTPPPIQTPEWESQKVEIAKARAELEIDRRIAALDKLSSKINLSEKLSEALNSQITNEVESQIPFLSSLRERISNHTNYASLVADINTLSDSYKDHQVAVSKVSIILIADKINVLGDAFTAIAEKLSQKTGELHALGKDIRDVQKTLGNMLFVLGDAANKAENATVLALPLTAQDYPKNKSVLGNAKASVQTSYKDLQSALSNTRNILNSLNAIESGKAPQRNFFQFFPLFRF